MQSELTSILTNLSDDTKIGLHAFSTTGKANNKSWAPSNNRLVDISEPGMRDSAIAFVNTLDDPYPGSWGGTKPWNAMQKTFNNEEVDTPCSEKAGMECEEVYTPCSEKSHYKDTDLS